MTTRQSTKIHDPAVMRALAHPVRLALLEHLSETAGGATATECGAIVGLTASATSYHLRALAKVGIIREAPGRGDGRERVWQTVHESFDISSEPDSTAEKRIAEAALAQTVLARQDEKVRRFLAQESRGEWSDVATIMEAQLVLTARELGQLTAQIDALIEPLRKRARTRPPRGARQVSFQLRAVPADAS